MSATGDDLSGPYVWDDGGGAGFEPPEPRNWFDCANRIVALFDATLSNIVPVWNYSTDFAAAATAFVADFKNGKLNGESALNNLWNLGLGLVGATATNISLLSTPATGPVGFVMGGIIAAGTTVVELVSLEAQAPKAKEPFHADWNQFGGQSFQGKAGFLFASFLDGIGATNFGTQIAEDCGVLQKKK